MAHLADERPGVRRLLSLTMATLVSILVSGSAQGPAPTPSLPESGRWAAWIESDFPFFSSVLDAGRAGASFPAKNLSPRTLVLNLGRGYWAGFDTDLLRIVAIWSGSGVTPKALAPGSYHVPDRKTPNGQSPAPEPEGTVWIANGIYPGWQAGARPLLEDPRDPAPSPEEVGRGPLDERQGRFNAVRLIREGAVLEYTVGRAAVREWMTADPRAVVRHFEVGASTEPLWLLLGSKAPGTSVTLCDGSGVTPTLETVPAEPSPVWAVRVPPHEEAVRFCAVVGEGGGQRGQSTSSVPVVPSGAPPRRWSQEVTTGIAESTATDAYVVDDIALPVDNPWRRNVRPGDIQFLTDGTGVTVTLDGDVWIVRGLDEQTGQRALEALRVRTARATDRRDSRRSRVCLRSQRHLAASRHERRRRG